MPWRSTVLASLRLRVLPLVALGASACLDTARLEGGDLAVPTHGDMARARDGGARDANADGAALDAGVPDLSLPPPDLTRPYDGPDIAMKPPPDFAKPPDLNGADLVVVDFTVLPDLYSECNDGVKDGSETDVDCGGAACPKCGAAKVCIAARDCKSGTCAAGVCTAPPTSFAPATYAANTTPAAIVSADFDGQSGPDIAVANSGSNSVSVLLNRGNGTFGGAVDYPLPMCPGAVALTVTDISGDGNPDLGVGCNQGNVQNTFYLINNMNNKGAFTVQPSSMTAATPRGAGGGDFDNDAIGDFVLTDQASPRVRVRYGNLNIFFFPISANNAAAPWYVVPADLNEDGFADLITANSGSSEVGIILNNRNGGFGSFTVVATDRGPKSVAAADIDRDGHIDIVTGNSASTTATVLIGNGRGALANRGNIALGFAPSFVALGDFNNDGYPDGIALNPAGARAWSLLGTGNASYFTLGTAAVVGTTPIQATVADFNRDGHADCAVANSGSNNVTVLINTAP